MMLYSRNDCPLCEDAEDTLIKLNIKYTFIDIDKDKCLRKKYNARIPVLVNSQKEEISWPFKEKELRDFCKPVK